AVRDEVGQRAGPARGVTSGSLRQFGVEVECDGASVSHLYAILTHSLGCRVDTEERPVTELALDQVHVSDDDGDVGEIFGALLRSRADAAKRIERPAPRSRRNDGL